MLRPRSFLGSELTSMDRRAVPSVTFVNAAMAVRPEVPASGHVESQGHWIGPWTGDHFKPLSLHGQQADGAPLRD